MVLTNIYNAKHLEQIDHVFYLILHNTMLHSLTHSEIVLSPYFIKDTVVDTGSYSSEQDTQKFLPSRGSILVDCKEK